jgi:hypothetical protein
VSMCDIVEEIYSSMTCMQKTWHVAHLDSSFGGRLEEGRLWKHNDLREEMALQDCPYLFH